MITNVSSSLSSGKGKAKCQKNTRSKVTPHCQTPFNFTPRNRLTRRCHPYPIKGAPESEVERGACCHFLHVCACMRRDV